MYIAILKNTGWTVVKLLGTDTNRPAGIRPKSKPLTAVNLSYAEAKAAADAMNLNDGKGA